jgi:hypothetical protein
MIRWGIGLKSFDPFTGVFAPLKHPGKTKPFSREHRMYDISQMLAFHGKKGKVGEVDVTM